MSGQITITGGFYREICRFPPSDEFWGSGGRAAAAIGDLGVDTTFVTVADSRAEPVLAGGSVRIRKVSPVISSS